MQSHILKDNFNPNSDCIFPISNFLSFSSCTWRRYAIALMLMSFVFPSLIGWGTSASCRWKFNINCGSKIGANCSRNHLKRTWCWWCLVSHELMKNCGSTYGFFFFKRLIDGHYMTLGYYPNIVVTICHDKW